MKVQNALRDVLRQDPVIAARELLGAQVRVGECLIRIVETEGYRGYDDPGSHAHRGPTPRTQVMFGEPGHTFVYFTYGNHWMLNFVAGDHGTAGAVLVRAAIPMEGLELMRTRRPKALNDFGLLSGPGKIAAALGLTGIHNGLDALSPDAWVQLEPGSWVNDFRIGPRIGLATGKGDTFPWRFVDANQLQWVSASKRSLQPPPRD